MLFSGSGRYAITVLVLSMSFIATACGSNASFSPVGPDGTASGGAVITGVVNGAAGPAAPRSTTAGPLATNDSPVQIAVSGTGISSTADGQGRFTLTGVPGGDVELHITGPNANASVKLTGVSPTDRIEITVTVNGSAARVDSEHRSSNGNGNGVQANGRITSIDTGARTITVNGRTISVPTSAVIRHGSRTFTLADLRVGDHVEVKGTMNGTTLVATEVKVEQDDDDDDDDANEVEVSGAVSGLSGNCTTGLTFTVQSTTVKTNNSTSFKKIGCSSIANGTRVEVEGTRQSDNSVLASEIELDD